MKHRIVLSCGHEVYFKAPTPHMGETLYCLKCACNRQVKDAPPDFKARCTTCSFSRRFGRDRESTRRAIRQHIAKHPTHTVQFKDGRKLLELFNESQEQLKMSG